MSEQMKEFLKMIGSLLLIIILGLGIGLLVIYTTYGQYIVGILVVVVIIYMMWWLAGEVVKQKDKL